MGLFGKLFEKKECSVCGGEIGLLGNRKLEDGNLCKNCAIGTGCIVMPGVTVGEGAVVGAGSLVTKDIPAWSLALGSPAKVVKYFKESKSEE